MIFVKAPNFDHLLKYFFFTTKNKPIDIIESFTYKNTNNKTNYWKALELDCSRKKWRDAWRRRKRGRRNVIKNKIKIPIHLHLNFIVDDE